MAALKHKAWIDPEGLTSVCLAGRMGDAFRISFQPDSRILTTFDATSHFDAMMKYSTLMDWGEYITDQERDYQPYPDEWLEVQSNSGSHGKCG